MVRQQWVRYQGLAYQFSQLGKGVDGLTQFITLYDQLNKVGFPTLLVIMLYCLIKPVYVHKSMYDDALKRADKAIEAADKATTFAWDQLRAFIEQSRGAKSR